MIKVPRRTCYIYIYSNTLFTITNGSGSKQSRQLISDANALGKYQYQEVICSLMSVSYQDIENEF